MKRNGFTLVEMLAVIVIMGILSLIIVPRVSKFIGNSTDTTYDTFFQTLKGATQQYFIDHPEEMPEKKEVGAAGSDYVTITAEVLIKGGYMQSLRDPENNKITCDSNSYVSVNAFKKAGTDSNVDTTYLSYKVHLECGSFIEDRTFTR